MTAEWKLMEGNRKYKVVRMAVIPECFAHHLPGESTTPCLNDGKFDTPTKYGPWANLCAQHLLRHTFRDTGIGYYLMTPGETDESLV